MNDQQPAAREADKPEHTPGPWDMVRWPTQSSGGSNTVFVIGPMSACIYDDWRARGKDISEEQNVANANLIAATPDLYEACKAMLKFEAMHTIVECDESVKDQRFAALDMIEKAVAKAEGRQ